MSQTNFVPDFVPFFISPILFRLPYKKIFRMEAFLDIVSDFPDNEMSTVLCMEQQTVKVHIIRKILDLTFYLFN